MVEPNKRGIPMSLELKIPKGALFSFALLKRWQKIKVAKQHVLHDGSQTLARVHLESQHLFRQQYFYSQLPVPLRLCGLSATYQRKVHIVLLLVGPEDRGEVPAEKVI